MHDARRTIHDEQNMGRLKILVLFFLSVNSTLVSAQVMIRLFSNQSPESALFSVTDGKYVINKFNGESLVLSKGESVIISRFDGKLAVKSRNSNGFISDSVIFSGLTGNDKFSLRINIQTSVRQYYSGDLKCFPDLATLVMINICDVEKYVAGVVMSEGGSGKNIEYFKSQAVIARTYMYRYINKHLSDGYNVCDNTHCQAFNGSSSDSILNMAAMETRGLVIMDSDSTLIESAFHSNCGGETASSGDVWLTGQPYLKKVIDPYCLSSRNAIWRKSIGINDWLELIEESGYTGKSDDPSVFSFSQKSRLSDYRTGSFTIPLTILRSELNLRSTFFSVFAEGDSIILRGRGYGHGVGLCQEGAMVMAAKGFSFSQIIAFYYSGVFISDIKNAVILPHGMPPNPPKGRLTYSH
jgi:stage II sporulation protein D